MTFLNTILQNDTVKVLVLDNQKSFIDYIKEPNTLIAITAIIVSIVGLYISVRYNRKTLEHTIKHNKLSVEPLLNFTFQLTSLNDGLTIKLKNNGLGTAIIDYIDIFYKEVKYINFKDFFNKNKISFYVFPQYIDLKSGSCLSSNNEIILCLLESNSMALLKDIELMLNDVKMNIKYLNMYGDIRELYSTSLFDINAEKLLRN